MDLLWNVFRSIFTSSPRTTTQCSAAVANWRSLRVSRIRGQVVGISSVVLCRKLNPLIVTYDELANTKLCAPVRVTPPRDSATIVIGDALVPLRPLTEIGEPDGTAYEPFAT